MIIRFDDDAVVECNRVILIPEKALSEAGFITTISTNTSAQSKHEFQTMAEMAFLLFGDGELDVETMQGSLTVEWNNERETMSAGLVAFFDLQGHLRLIAHPGQNVKKLLEVAHRFCTRWVRLDL